MVKIPDQDFITTFDADGIKYGIVRIPSPNGNVQKQSQEDALMALLAEHKYQLVKSSVKSILISRGWKEKQVTNCLSRLKSQGKVIWREGRNDDEAIVVSMSTETGPTPAMQHAANVRKAVRRTAEDRAEDNRRVQEKRLWIVNYAIKHAQGFERGPMQSAYLADGYTGTVHTMLTKMVEDDLLSQEGKIYKPAAGAYSTVQHQNGEYEDQRAG